MGSKVENCQGLESGLRGYLFFGNELHVGVTETEEHKNILAGSSRTRAEVLVAGHLLVSGDMITVEGDGSMSLKIEYRNPTPVAEFIKGFPDAPGRDIFPREQ